MGQDSRWNKKGEEGTVSDHPFLLPDRERTVTRHLLLPLPRLPHYAGPSLPRLRTKINPFLKLLLFSPFSQ